MTVLVLLEHDRGELAEAARQALNAARPLAEELGVPVHGVLVGEDAAPLAQTAADFGAEVVHVATHELLSDYGPDAWAETTRQLGDALDADVVLSVGSDRGNEVMAHLAARSGLPFVANCSRIAPNLGPWSITRIQWGGSLLEDVTLAAPRKIVTIAHHAAAATPVHPDCRAVDLRLERFEPELDESVAVTMIRGRDGQRRGSTLSTAPVVIGGGRGVGSADGFSVLEELAELLQGRVGCSRAATNNGWRPHSDQVGQTGTRISPDVYIAAGISGAIQHWVGAMAAKKIVAINTDPDANMVAKADYAVIADLHEVLPAISEEIRRRRDA